MVVYIFTFVMLEAGSEPKLEVEGAIGVATDGVPADPPRAEFEPLTELRPDCLEGVAPRTGFAVGGDEPEDTGSEVATVEEEETGMAELNDDTEDVPSPQLKLYKGVVLNAVPTTPKLGFGAVG